MTKRWVVRIHTNHFGVVQTDTPRLVEELVRVLATGVTGEGTENLVIGNGDTAEVIGEGWVMVGRWLGDGWAMVGRWLGEGWAKAGTGDGATAEVIGEDETKVGTGATSETSGGVDGLGVGVGNIDEGTNVGEEKVGTEDVAGELG